VLQPSDPNPERLFLANTLVPTFPILNVGDGFAGSVVGVVGYNFDNFKILVSDPLPPVAPGGIAPETTPLTHQTTNHLAVASINVENLAATDPVTKFSRLAAIVVTNLGAPDIMAVAKALGNGFPIGACLATEKAAAGMVPGTHGSTFGGNPMAVACGNAVLDVMLEPSFFERTQRLARLLQNKLEALIGAYPKLFAELRGSGHLLGIRCQPALTAGDFVAKLRAEGLLCLTAGDNVLRILPPLIAGEREIEEGLGILHKVAKEWPAS